jgi:hypothetical protein
MKTKIYRQGDVLIEAVKTLPGGLKPAKRAGGRIILAEGETTGHAHAIVDKEVESFVDEQGNLYLSVEAETVVKHEEHGAITLPIGYYKITRQREYAPDAIRNVAD